MQLLTLKKHDMGSLNTPSSALNSWLWKTVMTRSRDFWSWRSCSAGSGPPGPVQSCSSRSGPPGSVRSGPPGPVRSGPWLRVLWPSVERYLCSSSRARWASAQPHHKRTAHSMTHPQPPFNISLM